MSAKMIDLAASSGVADSARAGGVVFLASSDLLGTVRRCLADVKSSPVPAVDGALEIVSALARVKGEFEPYTLQLLPAILERLQDKAASSKAAATAAATAIIANLTRAAVPFALATLYECLNSKTRKWQTRVGALERIGQIAVVHFDAIPLLTPEIIPRLSEQMTDARKEVTVAAEAALTAVCATIGNRDIEAVIPQIIHVIGIPSETPECIHALSSTTFVQAVEQPTLAILVPLLMRGLVERSTPVKRRTAIIISNMAKLVPQPWMAAPMLPKLLPGLKKLRDEVSDPECRAVATKAFETLLAAADCKTEEEALAKAAGMAAATTSDTKGKVADKKAAPAPAKGAPAVIVAGDAASAEPVLTAPAAATLALLGEALALANLDAPAALAAKAGAAAPAGSAAAVAAIALGYLAACGSALAEARDWTEASWKAAFAAAAVPLARCAPGTADAAAAAEKVDALAIDVLNRAFFAATGKSRADAGDGDAAVTDPDAEDASIPDLCKCEFSLAYGGKILLNTAKLHMKLGRKYGLIGPNGCGKSTLMKAIANGQLEGFPSKTELRTCYVEHDIQAIQEAFSVMQYVLSDPLVIEVMPADRAAAEKAVYTQLSELGFTDKMIHGNVTALSGGWKMKCALARALLAKVSLMLLDEPTNHLDLINAAWLTDYIAGLTDVSCMLVSHDTGFLDAVCTHIIHYESFKLRTYKGNLSYFVTKKPEAKAYYELSATQFKFSFPEPGFLDGVRSKDKAILKVMRASYTYPGRDTPQIKDATVAISLSSRVVVHGRNGAGKSTLIKCITGEVEPQGGQVWKHPAVRIAYVAQHAFHHIEEHLQSTPMEYLQWRYASGEDREALAKATRQISEEQAKKMAAAIMIGGVKLVVQELLARRKSGKSYEYEVAFVGQPKDKNQWLQRDWLEAQGWGKAVDALDAREAAAAGLLLKPLTAARIVEHMEKVGLESEFVLHHRMAGLSGGQKIKVVLGAALWQNPHLLIMDEPSNYLDRDSLGALAIAIKEFGGGVLLVTHHSDFTAELCSETWNVADAVLTTTGQAWAADKIDKKEEPDEYVDASGNVIKIKKKLTGKDLRKKNKERAMRRKKGEEDVSSDEEEEAAVTA